MLPGQRSLAEELQRAGAVFALLASGAQKESGLQGQPPSRCSGCRSWDLLERQEPDDGRVRSIDRTWRGPAVRSTRWPVRSPRLRRVEQAAPSSASCIHASRSACSWPNPRGCRCSPGRRSCRWARCDGLGGKASSARSTDCRTVRRYPRLCRAHLFGSDRSRRSVHRFYIPPIDRQGGSLERLGSPSHHLRSQYDHPKRSR